MTNRIAFRPQAPAVPCEECGYHTLRVASVMDDHGHQLGRTMICTTCEERRYGVREETAGAAKPAGTPKPGMAGVSGAATAGSHRP